MTHKKIICLVFAIVVILGLAFIVYNQTISKEYVPADDEIVLHINFNIQEDVGLLVYDYRIGNHDYSGGISNADGSLLKRDSNNIVMFSKEEFNDSTDGAKLWIQFRIITEYVTPNYENVYPDEITKYMDPLSWEIHFGESYSITITGDKTNGYQAVFH